jgi:hypothetical protein
MQHIFNLQLNNWGHIEYRESADDSWHHVSDIDIDRAQQGTTLLFGIGETRSGFPPIAPNRGIPDDVSDPTRTDYESASTEGQRDDRFGQTVLTGEDVAHTDWEEASPSEQVVCRPQGVTTSEWRGSIYVPREGGWAKANLFASLLDISDAQEAALARGETIDYTIPDEQTLLINSPFDEDETTTVELRRYNRRDDCYRWSSVINHVRDLAEQYGAANARVVVWFTPSDKHPSIPSGVIHD